MGLNENIFFGGGGHVDYRGSLDRNPNVCIEVQVQTNLQCVAVLFRRHVHTEITGRAVRTCGAGVM